MRLEQESSNCVPTESDNRPNLHFRIAGKSIDRGALVANFIMLVAAAELGVNERN